MKVVTDKYRSADGNPLAGPLAVLPPVTTKRWVARRKAEVVAAVHGGVLTIVEACRRYSLSNEEFQEWERHYQADGLKGLRVSSRPRHPVH